MRASADWIRCIEFYGKEQTQIAKVEGGNCGNWEEFVVPDGHQIVGVEETHCNNPYLRGLAFITIKTEDV